MFVLLISCVNLLAEDDKNVASGVLTKVGNWFEGISATLSGKVAEEIPTESASGKEILEEKPEEVIAEENTIPKEVNEALKIIPEKEETFEEQENKEIAPETFSQGKTGNIVKESSTPIEEESEGNSNINFLTKIKNAVISIFQKKEQPMPLLAPGEACPNREAITSEGCDCNGVTYYSGYCCYYDPAVGDIQHQDTTCGYTKWSPHWEHILVARDTRGYKYPDNPGNQSLVQQELQWFAEHHDQIMQIDYFDTIEHYNPTIEHLHYSYVKTVMVPPYNLPNQNARRDALIDFASSHGYNIEDAYLHVSEQTTLSFTTGETITIDPCPGGIPQESCRYYYYDWNSYRWIINPNTELSRNYFIDEFSQILYTPNSEGNYVDGLMLDEFLGIAGITYPPVGANIIDGGGILEYNGLDPFEIDGPGRDPGVYDDDHFDFLVALKEGLPDKLILGNTASYYHTNDALYLIDAVDGEFYEFALGMRNGWSQPVWVRDRLWPSTKTLTDKGKVVVYTTEGMDKFNWTKNSPCSIYPGGEYATQWCPSDYNAGNYESPYSRLEIFFLANYYLGKDADNKLTYIHMLYGDVPYLDTWIEAQEVDIGRPTGDYYVYQTNIYARDFTKGLVLTRLEDNTANHVSSISVSLGGDYYLVQADGSIDPVPINTIDLRSAEAAILLRENPLQPETCSEQNGEICEAGQECTDNQWTPASDSDLCCLTSCYWAAVPPTISDFECYFNNAWQNCDLVSYGDTIEQVHATCIQGDNPISDVSFVLHNEPDGTNLIDGLGTANGGVYILNVNPDLEILDSGDFTFTATCRDVEGASNFLQEDWSLPWGTLNVEVVNVG